MGSLEPPEPASNWDFTAVLDLLKSPGYEILQKSRDTERSIPSDNGIQQDVNIASSPTRQVTLQESHTKLGDFSHVWDALYQDSRNDKEAALSAKTPSFLNFHQRPPPTRVGTVLKRDAPDLPPQKQKMGTFQSILETSSSPSSSQPPGDQIIGCLDSSSQPQAVTILQRAQDSNSSGSDATIRSTPRTLPIPIPNASHANKIAVNPRNTRLQKANLSDATLTESGTDVESDSNTIIFDRPVSHRANALAFVPAQLGTADARVGLSETPPSSLDDLDHDLTFPNIRHTSSRIRVLPATYKNSAERQIGLMTKLLHEFPEYAKLLSQVGRLPPDTKTPPVHVFVDMSNITVGFHESVKVSRNIPATTRIRRLHMSFFNISMIMERGRPAAKRVLAGSDRLPSIDEAEKLGYEINILDRVRVKNTQPKSRQRSGSQSASKGPETAPAAGNRWVEQGVDEILHLKILESLLDTDQPATIVLATGDAAEAEYSGGFMRMVERALQRGWSVELVSFSRLTSKAYHRKEFRAKWGKRFQVIDLDHYVEELFDW